MALKKELARRWGTVVLGGWLLMWPPTDHSRNAEEAGKVPITQWVHMRSFDSAKQCEAYRSEEHARLEIEAVRADVQKDALGSLLKGMANKAALGKCIPADHLYPPKASSTD